AKILEDLVIGDAEACAYGCMAASPRRIRDAELRRERRKLRARLAEVDQSRHAGQSIQLLLGGVARNSLVVPSQAPGNGEVGTEPVRVVEEQALVDGVPDVRRGSDVALRKNIRVLIQQVTLQRRVFVVTTHALDGGRGRNVLAALPPEFDR